MELLESIKPQNTKDIIGNRLQINNFKNLIKQGGKAIVLVGPVGCGKTLICDLVFKELKLKAYDVSNSLQDIPTILQNKSIDGITNRVLFLDNLEIVLETNRTALSTIKKFLPLLKTTCFVITTKQSEERTLQGLKVDIIKLGYPTTKDAFAYLLDKLPDIDEDRLLNIVKKQRGNIRDSVLNLYISNPELDEMVKDRGFAEYNNFEIVSSFISKPCWNIENSAVSYLLYENYPDEIYTNREATATLKFCKTMNNYFLQASLLEHHTKYAQTIRLGGMICGQEDLKRKKEQKSIKFRGFKFPPKIVVSFDMPVLDAI